MLDFTSALYLGFRHAYDTLRPWAQLTTGRPAALEPPREAESVAQDSGPLLGCERATLATFDASPLLGFVRCPGERIASRSTPMRGSIRSPAGASSGRRRRRPDRDFPHA